MKPLRTCLLLLALASTSASGCGDDPTVCDASDIACEPAPLSQASTSEVAPEADGEKPSDASTTDCRYPHAAEYVKRIGDRVLAAGRLRWVLFDVPSGRAIASGPLSPKSRNVSGFDIVGVDLAGTRVLIPGVVEKAGKVEQRGLMLLDARDGAWVATLASDGAMTQAGLAPDGSYAWGASDDALNAWTSEGRLIARRPGYYRSAKVLATALRLQVYAMPHAEVLQPRDGSVSIVRDDFSSTTAAQRNKFSWFDDGSLLTEVSEDGSTVYFYTPDGKRVRQLGPIARFRFRLTMGYGRYYVADADRRVGLYTVDAALDVDGIPRPQQPLAGDERVLSSGRGWILVHGSKTTPSLIDLRGTSIRSKRLAVQAMVSAFGTDDAGNWVLATDEDEIHASDGPATISSRKLGCRAP